MRPSVGAAVAGVKRPAERGGAGNPYALGALSWGAGSEPTAGKRALSSPGRNGHVQPPQPPPSPAVHASSQNSLHAQGGAQHPHQPQGHQGVQGVSPPAQPPGSCMEEAEAAEARAMEAKVRSEEARVRSEAAAAEAASAAVEAEVAKEAATAVVEPLPATKEAATTDGRVGRRENAFLNTYFAFFGRFAR